MANAFADLIAQRIGDAGFPDPLDFFLRHPAAPYGVLYRRIGHPVTHGNHRDIPFLAFLHFHRRLHISRLGERHFARDALARSLAEHLKGGWGSADSHLRAVTSWNQLERECTDQYIRVWDAIKALNPPRAWRPADPEDPIITAAFDQAWPA